MPSLIVFVIILLAVLALYLVALYNGLITGKRRVEESLSDIDVQLKRRYDLIPNLVEAVKGYMAHEKNTLEEITSARAAAMKAHGLKSAPIIEQEELENALTEAVHGFFAVAENYPVLQASQNFLQLQNELSDTENKIQAARRFYNGNARDFNIKISVIPANLIAGRLGFTSFDFFHAIGAEKENVKVKF